MSISKKRTSIMLFALVGVIITSNIGTVVYAAEATATAPSAKVLEIIKKSKPDNTTTAKPAPNIKITVNGKAATLTDPIIMENGRTFLPVRSLGDLLKIKVDYNTPNKIATAQNEKAYLELPLGYNQAVKNKIDILQIDATNSKTRTILYNSRTYLPVRFISENLGYQISYSNNTVSITTDGTTPTTPTEPTTPTTPVDKDESGIVKIDSSKMNPNDPSNPENLKAFKGGRALNDLPTIKGSELKRPAGIDDDTWNNIVRESNKFPNDGVVLVSGKLSDIPGNMNHMSKSTGESLVPQVNTIHTLSADSKTGLLTGGGGSATMDIRFKDGSLTTPNAGQDISTGRKDGVMFPGKTVNDIAFITIKSGDGFYLFMPTGK